MRTTIEEILNKALIGKIITIYVGEYFDKSSKFYTMDKRALTTEIHKRIIKNVDLIPFENDVTEVSIDLTENILSKPHISFDISTPFEIE